MSAEIVIPAVRNTMRWGDAVSVGGYPADFKVSLSPRNRKTWFIHLHGGAPVYDREPSLSSVRRPPDKHFLPWGFPDGKIVEWNEGRPLLSRTRTNYLDRHANMVTINNVSGDAWLGSKIRETQLEGGVYRFRGQIIVEAVIECLIEYYGLDDYHPDTRLLLFGGSGGGAGAQHSVYTLAKLLPNTADHGRIKYITDSGSIFRKPKGWKAKNGIGYVDNMRLLTEQLGADFSHYLKESAKALGLAEHMGLTIEVILHASRRSLIHGGFPLLVIEPGWDNFYIRFWDRESHPDSEWWDAVKLAHRRARWLFLPKIEGHVIGEHPRKISGVSAKRLVKAFWNHNYLEKPWREEQYIGKPDWLTNPFALDEVEFVRQLEI